MAARAVKFALADQLELLLAQARGQVARLTSSLLAQAFAGPLVPQIQRTERKKNYWNEFAVLLK